MNENPTNTPGEQSDVAPVKNGQVVSGNFDNTPGVTPGSSAPASPEAPLSLPPTDTYVGLAGSQIEPQRMPLPVGVYIIAGLNFIGFVVSFFDTSQTSLIYTIAMFVSLLLALGLVMRQEAARKSMVWLAGVLLVLSVVCLVLLSVLQQRIEARRADYDAAVSRIDQNRLNFTQKQQLATLQTEMETLEKQAGKAITFTYIKLGATALETIAIMVYLTRPKVKEVFLESEI